MKQLFFSLLACLFFCACDGGSSGTGGTVYKGTLLFEDGSPVVGAEVQLAADPAAIDVTDQTGAFEVESEITGNNLALGVTISGDENIVALEPIPMDAEVVEIELSYDPQSSQVTLEDIDVDSSEPPGANRPSRDPRDDRGARDMERDPDEPSSPPNYVDSQPDDSGSDSSDAPGSDDEPSDSSGTDGSGDSTEDNQSSPDTTDT